MMVNSVVALIQHRHRNRDHLPLLQRQITVPVHHAIVKGHQRPQSSLVQAMSLDNIVHPTPRTRRPFIDFGNGSPRLIL